MNVCGTPALGAEREPTRRQIKPSVAGVERDDDQHEQPKRAAEQFTDLVGHRPRVRSERASQRRAARTLRLGRTFDAVFAHDAIAYMTSEDDLEAVLRTAYVHIEPPGLGLFVRTDEADEGMRAFSEKRQPDFSPFRARVSA